MGNEISFTDGLLVTALGMGVTFTALIALSFMLDLLRMAFYKDPNKNKPVEVKQEAKTTVEENKTDKDEAADEELIAVITAAVAASLNTSTHNIVVRNIVRTPDSTPAWGRSGRIDQMNQML